MNRRFQTGLFAWLGAAGVLLAPAGYARAQATAPAARLPAPTAQAANEQLRPVADAAWAVLQALHEYVHAAQSLDNPQQRAESLAAAKRNLMGMVTLRPGGDPEALETYVMMWPAVVAHYVDGLQRDKMTPVRVDQKQVLVMAAAANPHDQKVYDELVQQITKSLQDQGLSGSDLDARRQVLLTRELAQRGIGYPTTAVIHLVMRDVNGQWKASELDLRPPRVQPTGTQPALSQPSQAVPRTIITTKRPATQPAQ